MKKFLALASTVALLAGCQMADDVFSPAGKTNTKQFYGTIASETKTAVSQDGDVYHTYWQKGDEILITDGTNNGYYRASESGKPSSYFDFYKGEEMTTGSYEAYYPATAVNGFPGMQKYDNVVVPMFAQSDDINLTFKNLGSLLKFNVKTGVAGVSVKYLVISADQPMAGAYTVTDNAAVIEADGGSGVTLDCGEGVAISSTATPFYVSVAPGEYTNFTVKMITTDGKSQSKTYKSTLTAVRSQYHDVNIDFSDLADGPALGGDAFLPDGPVFNATVKQLFDPLATEVTPDNSKVKKIVFDTNSLLTSDTQIEDLSSDDPIYASFDAGSGTLTISTPAETIYTSADASCMFQDFGACEEIVNLKCLNTENAETMNHMFCMAECDTSYLKTLDLSGFNTSNVYTFRSMFNGMKGLETIDLSSFDTGNLETMLYMFRNCTSLKEIDMSPLNVEYVSDLSYLFYNCLSLEKVNFDGWDTSNVGNFSYMFWKCWGLTSIDLSDWDTSSATTFAFLFYWCRNLTDVNLTGWDTSSATSMSSMFNSCYSLRKLDISSFSCESLPLGSDRINGLDYTFQQCGALEEMWLGEDFGSDPSHPCLASAFEGGDGKQTAANNRTAMCNTTGTLVIHCNQDVADWCARTSLRWINSGYQSFEKPVPVIFVDTKTGKELSVTWRAN